MIVPLSPKHQAAWKALWLAYLDFYRHPLNEEISQETFKRLCRCELGLRGYLLLSPLQEPIGFVHTLYHANTWSAKPKCYLEDLFVTPSARGKSYGRALIEHVYQQALADGCGQVYWNTNADNTPARLLYDRVATLGDWVRYHKNFE